MGAVTTVVWGMLRAKRLGHDPEIITDLASVILLGGFIGARCVHVFLYRWVDFKDDLGQIFELWNGGLSSFGGILGGVSAGLVLLHRRKLDIWKYVDVAIFVSIPGWFIGRLGCFAIHDHPGHVSDFLLAAEMKIQPIGMGVVIQARHDLGLYDALLALVICIVFLWLDRKERFDGFYAGWACILYSVPRFFFDFLRATDLSSSDTRYMGLTPAQYGAIILLALGGWIIWVQRHKVSEHAS